MAKFKKGDWVKIIPTPDTDSDVWTSSHNKYCDKIGKVLEINDNYDDMLLLRIGVYFNYRSSTYSGEKSEWFEDKHLILSSQWEADRIEYLSDKFEEYKRFEHNIKRKRDEIFKQIFTEPEPEKEEPDYKQGWIFGDDWYMRDVEFD